MWEPLPVTLLDRVHAQAHVCECVCVWGKGGGCMSRLSRAADSCYRLDAYRGTQASHDGSHSAHAVPTRAVTAPRKTDGGSVNGK